MRTRRKARFEVKIPPLSLSLSLSLKIHLHLCSVLFCHCLPFLLFLVKLSWPKTLVKKWFNIKSKAEDFQADDVLSRGDCSIFLMVFDVICGLYDWKSKDF